MLDKEMWSMSVNLRRPLVDIDCLPIRTEEKESLEQPVETIDVEKDFYQTSSMCEHDEIGHPENSCQDQRNVRIHTEGSKSNIHHYGVEPIHGEHTKRSVHRFSQSNCIE